MAMDTSSIDLHEAHPEVNFHSEVNPHPEANSNQQRVTTPTTSKKKLVLALPKTNLNSPGSPTKINQAKPNQINPNNYPNNSTTTKVLNTPTRVLGTPAQILGTPVRVYGTSSQVLGTSTQVVTTVKANRTNKENAPDPGAAPMVPKPAPTAPKAASGKGVGARKTRILTPYEISSMLSQSKAEVTATMVVRPASEQARIFFKK